MKKFLALILILILCLAFAGCGGDKGSDEPLETPGDEIVEEDPYVEVDAAGTFDFGFTAEREYAMADLVAQLDTEDISAHAEKLRDMTLDKAESVLGGSFEGSGEYIEDYEEGVDQMTEAIAIEDGNSEKIYLSTGIYQYSDGEFYQYTRYAGASMYELSEKNIEKAISDIKKGYGVTVPQDKVEAAVKEVLENTEAYGGYYSLYDSREFDGGDFTETISVFVEGFLEDEVCAYLCVEREVCYK